MYPSDLTAPYVRTVPSAPPGAGAKEAEGAGFRGVSETRGKKFLENFCKKNKFIYFFYTKFSQKFFFIGAVRKAARGGGVRRGAKPLAPVWT